MEQILNLYKKPGETPLERIKRFKSDNPEYENISMTYAGRLDPLAEGVLLVLAGEEVHQKEKYLSLPKVYEVEILFGIETDTYDPLGIVIQTLPLDIQREGLERRLREILPQYNGRIRLPYPAYSSKPVGGVPLFKHAREGKLDEIEIPEREMEITRIENLGLRMEEPKRLLREVEQRIASVSGDFRQKEILDSWRASINSVRFRISQIPIIKLRISCSSGTYVRAIAHDIGQKLGCGAIAFHISRTSVGDFKITHSIL